MKTSKQYIEMVGHSSTINGNGNIISQDMQELNVRLSMSGTKTTNQAIHEYLNDNIDLDDFGESYQHEAKNVQFDIDKDEFLSSVYYHLDSDPIIAHSRITEGFKVGLIDVISNAFLKTDRGWVNDQQEVILPSDASIEDLTTQVRNHARIAPSFSISDLETAEETGQCFMFDRMIASKNENNEWIDHSTGKSFRSGELIRLLHHRNNPVVIMTGVPEGTLYHANVTDSKIPQKEHTIREGISRQGDAAYTTTSVDEAIRIYGNPYSFETRGKLLAEHENGNIDRDKYMFGHLYEFETSANVYQASIKSKYLTFNDVPSASAVTLLAKETNKDSLEGFSQNWWMKMKSASSTFEVYRLMNEFSERVMKDGGDTNTLKKLYGAMGFQGLEITIPSKEYLARLDDKLNHIKSLDENDFREHKLPRKESLIKEIESYIASTKDAIPAKAQNSHVIIFDSNNTTRTYLAMLPLNKKVLGKEDYFYNREKEISLNDIIKTKEKELDSTCSM